jgi:phosphoribosylformylglycinamidine (FGAM) synthase-like enzyme
MVLAVPPAAIERLRSICELNDVEMCELGHFGTEDGDLILRYHRTEVGRLTMAFLHDGLPRTAREAIWEPHDRQEHGLPLGGKAVAPGSGGAPTLEDALLGLLAHPNIASRPRGAGGLGRHAPGRPRR